MIKIGNLILVMITAITVSLFVLSKQDISEIIYSPWLSLSQLVSLVGTVWLAFSFILASRAKFLENWWGGLDKVIRTHHIVGGMSFLMLVNHPLFLVINVLPNFLLATKYLFLSTNQIYNFGVIGLYVMILVLSLTFLVKLPYDLWLKTHDLIGIALFFGSLHVMFIVSDVSRFFLLKIWIMTMMLVGMYAYLYKVFLYRWFGPRYKYIVDSVRVIGDITEIYLINVSKKINFLPGQFAYINFESEGLGETHPFSFSSSPNEEKVRFSVKPFGDYTLKLKYLKPGTTANLWGSYGRMYEKFYGEKEVVAISGGIGITPFISLIKEELKSPKPRKITLFYCVKTQAEAVYIDELKQLNLPNLNIILFCSDMNQRLTIEEVEKTVGGLEGKVYYICGPKPMMDSMEEQLTRKKINRSNIIIEDFAFKE